MFSYLSHRPEVGSESRGALPSRLALSTSYTHILSSVGHVLLNSVILKGNEIILLFGLRLEVLEDQVSSE